MREGKVLIVYHSYGGNTQAVAELLGEKLSSSGYKVKFMKAKDLNRSKNYEKLFDCEMLILGSNTWGDGEMPEPMWKIIREIEKEENKDRLIDTVTGVFGTGESGYAKYCASVEIMRDIIHPISNFAVTIKIEQMYSKRDIKRIDQFVNLIDTRYITRGGILPNEEAK